MTPTAGSVASTSLRPVIFAGPSLVGSGVDAAQLDLRPPAGSGDVNWILQRSDRPRAIGIVDGDPTRPALSPKELIAALDAGVAVYGSSGEGALRAVECGTFGAIGVGRIFEEYASGTNDQADEVRSPLGDIDPSAGDHNLASWRIALSNAVVGGSIRAHDAHQFLGAAKALDWRARTLSHVAAASAASLSPQALAAISSSLRLQGSNLMRSDAEAMIALILSQKSCAAGDPKSGEAT